MNTHCHRLFIHMHKVNGSSETFIQNEESLIKHVLREFQSDSIFHQDQIVIAGRHSATCLPTRQLVRTDLVSEQLSDWNFPPGMVHAVELTETEFRALLQNPELREQRNHVSPQDASVIVFFEVEMTGQSPLFLVREMAGEQFGDGRHVITDLLSTRSLCFRMRSGGVAALNLCHLMRVTLFPGLHPAPNEAWPAERSQGSQLKEPRRVLPGPGDNVSTAHAAYDVAG
ncbi:MAG TPA: hypothetical protein VMJ12_11250 [Candidatus Acidoferrales bacterium]|nr:hypothetical protein [Candidatus Acidoferrales bacterium]